MKKYYSAWLGRCVAGLLLALSWNAAAAAAKATAVSGSIDPISGYQTLSGSLKRVWTLLNGTYVQTTSGTTAVAATIKVAGVSRRYIIVRPNPAPAGAPVLLLLHANGVTPENMANLTEVADYVQTQGFWAVLPAAIGGTWKDDPSTSNKDDTLFISALIDTLVTQGVDASRVYAGGYSNGGFMAERLACELSDKIVAFGINAATLRTGLANVCAPTKPRAKVYLLGTADTIVPYDGAFNMKSALSTMAYWNSKQGCGGVLASSLPDRAADGTTAQLTRYTGCNGGTLENRLYTITGGGHAWSGGLTSAQYVTSQDLKATGVIWSFVSAYRR
ncbi:hypothetical protein [Nevskia sp.]|uniref:alpha/beta hydrolase family esterase n=1 Tax=Nevskia sp. TaxID=1929292 RepID=UPI0025CEC01A|nr:hypothetical protein [Nevskia sp.]